jgi:hypothetical protein
VHRKYPDSHHTHTVAALSHATYGSDLCLIHTTCIVYVICTSYCLYIRSRTCTGPVMPTHFSLCPPTCCCVGWGIEVYNGIVSSSCLPAHVPPEVQPCLCLCLTLAIAIAPATLLQRSKTPDSLITLTSQHHFKHASTLSTHAYRRSFNGHQAFRPVTSTALHHLDQMEEGRFVYQGSDSEATCGTRTDRQKDEQHRSLNRWQKNKPYF